MREKKRQQKTQSGDNYIKLFAPELNTKDISSVRVSFELTVEVPSNYRLYLLSFTVYDNLSIYHDFSGLMVNVVGILYFLYSSPSSLNISNSKILQCQLGNWPYNHLTINI